MTDEMTDSMTDATTDEMTDAPSAPAEAAPCGCRDFAVSRRRLLGGMAGAAGAGVLSSVLGDVHRQVAFGATGHRNVVVLLSLRGGADGLSLVVPHGEERLDTLRPRIGVPNGRLLAKDAMFGLHPGFAPLLPMWRQRSFAAVHAVGLPQPNRSHFQAMEAIEDADPGTSERRGWINRLVGLGALHDPAEAVQLGGTIVPTSLYGPAPVLGLRSLHDLSLASHDAKSRRRQRGALHRTWDRAGGPLGQGVRTALATTQRLDSLAAPARPRHGAVYPKGDLGATMAQTATLIRADVGTRVVTVDCGSWDMHTQLGTLEWGAMRTMVSELARSLAAFFTDLGGLADRVTVVTVSEFGRRVAENGAGGLDHGYGNCMLLLGAGVRGGRVHGPWPGLGPKQVVAGDLAVTRDYRSVLTEVVRSRFPDLDSTRVFPDFRPEPVGAMG